MKSELENSDTTNSNYTNGFHDGYADGYADGSMNNSTNSNDTDNSTTDNSTTDNSSTDGNDTTNDNGTVQDSHLIPQLPFQNVDCDSGERRMIHEGKGNLEVVGDIFSDVSFPASVESVNYGSDFNWKRIPAFGKGNKIFNGRPSPHDVDQGSIGDCWLMNSMAAIAEHPELIEDMFITKEMPANRQIIVQFYWMGGRVNVTVDDQLASYSTFTYPKFASMGKTSHAWWAPILEKATAKFMGTYNNIRGGNMREGAFFLAGLPTYEFYHKDTHTTNDALWAVLQEYDTKGDLISGSVGCKYQSNAHRAILAAQNGLVNNHAYTCLGVASYTDPAGANHRLVRMRNPWAKELYNGTWSDHDTSKWTDHAKAALGHTPDANDGTFYISIADYQAMFDRTVVAYQRNWKRHAINSSWDRSTALNTIKYRITNPVTQDFAVGMDGAQRRHFKDSNCLVADRAESIPMNVRRINADGSKSNKSDINGQSYVWTITTYYGNGFFMFENLPAGEYEFYNYYGVGISQSTGVLPFGVIALGSQQAPVIQE